MFTNQKPTIHTYPNNFQNYRQSYLNANILRNNINQYYPPNGTQLPPPMDSRYVPVRDSTSMENQPVRQQSMENQPVGNKSMENQSMKNQSMEDQPQEEIDTPIATKQQMLEFRANIYQWLGHDDKMREYRTALKKINQDKNGLTDTIIKFMETYEVKDLTTSNGNLKYSVRTRKKINKDTLLKALSEYFNDEIKGQSATKYVLDNVPTVHIPYIKRSKPTNGSSKKSTNKNSISSKPSIKQSTTSSIKSSTTPSIKPSTTPSIKSSIKPSATPSIKPSIKPSTTPSIKSSYDKNSIPSVKSIPVKKEQITKKYKITRKLTRKIRS